MQDGLTAYYLKPSRGSKVFYRNRLLFGLIKTVVTTVWQVVYGLVCFLNLQPIIIIVLLWVILHFTGVTEKYSITTVLLCLGFVLAVLYSILTCLKQLFGLDKKPKARRGAETVNSKENERAESVQDKTAEEPTFTNSGAEQNYGTELSYTQEPTLAVTDEKPRYYRVKQNASLIMAEYSDRYELYKIADGKLLKIRTDYKD